MSIDNYIPQITVGKFIEEMSLVYGSAIKKEWPLSTVPAPFVWGPPGVGKSDAVKEIAVRIRESTGRIVEVTDVRLSMFAPTDIRGLPVVDAKKEFAVWLLPKIFALDPSPDVVNLLFFDELNSAPQQVQAAAYQITLDHRIGEHRFPDNCIIMGAGNRTIDKSVVFRMPNALANRMQHYEIAADFENWKKWALKAGIHPFVLGYLAFDNTKLCPETVPAEQVPFPSPRTWEFVSNLIRLMDGVKCVEDMYLQIASCVGSDTAHAFIAWVKIYKDIPDVTRIFRGRYSKYPPSPDALFIMIDSIIAYIKNREYRGEPMTKGELENLAVYAAKFPADYETCLYNALEKNEQLKTRLKMVKLYREFKRRTEEY